MTMLPNGWAESRLMDVARLGSGGTPQARNPRFYENGSIPWAIIGDLNDGLVTSTAKKITQEGLDSSSAKIVPAGTILLGMYGSIGKLGITSKPMATNQAIATIQASNRIDSRYLFYYLMSQRRDLDNEGKGATQLNISQTILKPWPVRYPTELAEQCHIVDLLEDHLSRLDAAGAAVSRSIRRLAALRDSGLSVAVERARESPLVEMRTLGKLAKVSSGMTPLKGNRSFYDGGTIPWITSGDLHQGTITKATQFVTQTALDETTLKVLPAGTLLIAMYGEGRTRGTAAELRIAATINQACAAVQLHDPALGPWIRLVLDANYSRLRRLAAGGVQPNLNLSIVRGIEVPIPDSSVRAALLAQRDEMDEANKRLLLELAAARRRAANLRHALLVAAFSGGLTEAFDLSEVEETLPG